MSILRMTEAQYAERMARRHGGEVRTPAPAAPAAKASKPSESDALRERLIAQILDGRLAERVEREFEFAPLRKYRADIAILGPRLIVEVDGIHAHRQKENVERDRWRDGLALELGWLTVRVTPKMIESGAAYRAVAAAALMRKGAQT